jgi:hypothetical protein
MEFKINGQTEIIDRVCEAIETSIMGADFKEDWNMERKDFVYGSTLYFSLKEGKEMKPDVIFWLGYHSGEGRIIYVNLKSGKRVSR